MADLDALDRATHDWQWCPVCCVLLERAVAPVFELRHVGGSPLCNGAVVALRASQAEQERLRGARSLVWLVELNDHSAKHLWVKLGGSSGAEFTSDANEAFKFPCRAEAEDWLRCSSYHNIAKVTEHIFLGDSIADLKAAVASGAAREAALTQRLDDCAVMNGNLVAHNNTLADEVAALRGSVEKAFAAGARWRGSKTTVGRVEPEIAKTAITEAAAGYGAALTEERDRLRAALDTLKEADNG